MLWCVTFGISVVLEEQGIQDVYLRILQAKQARNETEYLVYEELSFRYRSLSCRRVFRVVAYRNGSAGRPDLRKDDQSTRFASSRLE